MPPIGKSGRWCQVSARPPNGRRFSALLFYRVSNGVSSRVRFLLQNAKQCRNLRHFSGFPGFGMRRSPPPPQRNATGACQSAPSVIGGIDREHRRQAAPEVAMRTRNGRADTTGPSKGGPVGRPSDSSDPPEQNAPINVRAARLARAASCAIRRSRPVQASRMANSPWSLPHATPQSGTNARRYRRTHR